MKRKALTAGPKKKPKKTRSEVYAANFKHFGEEPTYDGTPLGMSQRIRSLTWYANMCDVNDAREYADEFLEKHSPDLRDGMKSVADTSFPLSASWMARMFTLGGHTEEGTKDFILKKFNEAVSKYAGRNEEKVDPDAVSAA